MPRTPLRELKDLPEDVDEEHGFNSDDTDTDQEYDDSVDPNPNPNPNPDPEAPLLQNEQG